jgi:hypothetical protein
MSWGVLGLWVISGADAETAELPEHEPEGLGQPFGSFAGVTAFFAAVCNWLVQGTGWRVRVGCGIPAVWVGAVAGEDKLLAALWRICGKGCRFKSLWAGRQRWVGCGYGKAGGAGYQGLWVWQGWRGAFRKHNPEYSDSFGCGSGLWGCSYIPDVIMLKKSGWD